MKPPIYYDEINNELAWLPEHSQLVAEVAQELFKEGSQLVAEVAQELFKEGWHFDWAIRTGKGGKTNHLPYKSWPCSAPSFLLNHHKIQEVLMLEQKTVEIPEAFIKSLHSCSCMPDVKREIETHFSQLFPQEVELEPGLYRDKAGKAHFLTQDEDGDYFLSNQDGFVRCPDDKTEYFKENIKGDVKQLRQIMATMRRVK